MNHHNNIYMAENEKNAKSKNSKTGKNSTKPVKQKNGSPNFEFTENQKSKCNDHGLDIHGQFERFKNYHQARGNQWKDWSKAFDNWILNAIEWSKPTQNQTQGQHHAPHSQPTAPKPNSDAEYALIRQQRNAELRAMGYNIS